MQPSDVETVLNKYHLLLYDKRNLPTGTSACSLGLCDLDSVDILISSSKISSSSSYDRKTLGPWKRHHKAGSSLYTSIFKTCLPVLNLFNSKNDLRYYTFYVY